MANHELYVVQGKTLDNIAGTMRAVLGVDKDTPIRFDEVANSDKTEQINTDIETQTDLIAQIKTALNGKAGSSAAEIGALIDQSGVLGTTDGTATEKVKQLLLYSKLLKFDNALSLNENFDSETIDYYLNFPYVVNIAELFRNNKHIKKIKGINTTKIHNLMRAFLSSTIEEIELPFDLSGVTSPSSLSGTFQTTSLKKIRFVQETIKFSLIFTSKELTVDSIRSIMGGLLSTATGQTLTIPLAAVKKAFETSEGKNDGDESAEWLSLKDSKPNWTISLS